MAKVAKHNRNLAIELIEEYDPIRVMGVVGLMLLMILLLTAVWLIEGGDASYVSGVMSYVLTFIGGRLPTRTTLNYHAWLTRTSQAIVGLTALWDWLELDRAGGTKDMLLLDSQDRLDGFRGPLRHLPGTGPYYYD